MKDKCNKFLTIVFGVIAIVLAGYIYYNKLNEGRKKEIGPKCYTKQETNIKDVIGLYGATIKDENTEEEITHYIYLMDNAMFSYVLKGDDETVVYIGNYQVNGNDINLNYWFDTDSNLEKYSIVNNKETLIFNSDKTIKLENNSKLKQITGDEKNKELSNKTYDVSFILDKATAGVRQ